ncbi:MAG: 6,7-dimethyl-8-ribityllumazine synthase [Hyphomicrobiales bacterium]|nr:MAG: 6,7-dimethyl-8-ribityllumazine synthase [Hyphomicrobiales bacterium]
MTNAAPTILVIDARFYDDIADELVRGAAAAIEAAGAKMHRISVPGVLEVPTALSMALEARDNDQLDFDAVVTLGCVIRGETSHYDIVAVESARALMDLAVAEGFPLGNGILTVENGEQAWVRAGVDKKNKGASAVEAALALFRLRGELGI